MDLDMPFLQIYYLRNIGNIFTSKLKLLSRIPLNSLDNWNTQLMCMYVSIKLNTLCENATGKSLLLPKFVMSVSQICGLFYWGRSQSKLLLSVSKDTRRSP